MSNEPPFQEKPDWKGKLSQLSKSFSSSFSRGKSQGTEVPTLPQPTETYAGPTEATPTQPTIQAPGFAPDAEPAERTFTQMVAENWKTRIVSRFPSFSRGGGGGGDGSGGGGGISASALSLNPPQFNEKTINTLVLAICIAFVAWIAADLTALVIDSIIPEPPPVRSTGGSEIARRMRTLNDYQVIFTRNLFNSRGLIPGDDLPATPTDNNNTPVKTSLPFNLVGTLVLKNELRSIATIEDTGEQKVYPVRVDDEIPGRARIIAIEPFKVIFVNPSNGRREFVEIPEDPNAAPRISLNTPGPKGDGVMQTSATNFNVAKTEVDAALSKWDETLTQARAVPHQENGQPAGFMLLQIVPASIYDKLGLKNRDVLCGVNGEPINDVSKAMELLNLLKTSSHIELCVKRQGKTSNFSYDIR